MPVYGALVDGPPLVPVGGVEGAGATIVTSPAAGPGGESIQRDMVAVRVSRDQRLAVVGSPEYFATHPKPTSPHDLPNHRCINLRAGAPRPYGWEFEKGDDARRVFRLEFLLGFELRVKRSGVVVCPAFAASRRA